MRTNNWIFQACLTLALLLTALLSVACQPGAVPTSTSSAPQTQVSLLVSANPPVQIKRDGWSNFAQAGAGVLVYPADLLKTDGTITLLCADMQTLKTVSGTGGNPCQSISSGLLEYDGMRFASGPRQGNIQATAGPNSTPTPPIPRILYPRATSVLETHPQLQWVPTGADSYTVEIHQGAKVIWTQAAHSNKLVYPDDAPTLQPGVDYQLVVRDNATGKVSGDEAEKGLGFQVISDQERQKVEGLKQEITGLTGLDAPAQKLALAVLYLNLKLSGGRGLWGEARALLDEAAQAYPAAPAVQLRRGEVLTALKLWPEAQAAYESALTEARKINDIESQAAALAAHWRLTREPADFDKALALYTQLGAADRVTQLLKEKAP